MGRWWWPKHYFRALLRWGMTGSCYGAQDDDELYRTEEAWLASSTQLTR